MSEYRTLAKHSSHYFIAHMGALMSSLISMPIITRLLTKEDFGRLSLILLSVNFFTTFARLGIPQSITRHFPEYRRLGAGPLRSYTSTVFLFSLSSSLALMLMLILLGWLTSFTRWNDWSSYIILVGMILCNEVILSVLTEMYRAEQKSLITGTLNIISRYSTLAASLLFFFYVSRTLNSFLAGKVLVQSLVLAAFFIPMAHWGYIKFQKIDFGIVRESIHYGLPLSIATAGGFFIAYGDRYVIQGLLGSVQVASYSLPYDFLQQIETGLTTPIRMAIVPMIFTMMINQGIESAAGFVSQVIRGFFFVIVPLIFGVSFLGRDIVVLLASEKYADSSVLLPVLSAGILFGGVNFLLTVGLSFQKRTDIIAYMTVAFGLFNILLNLLLIPLMGVMGSALATLISYGLNLAVSYRLSSPYLAVRFYPVSLLKALTAALCMTAGLWLSQHFLPRGLAGLAFKIPLGILIYALVVILLEAEIRLLLRGFLRKGKLLSQETA